ncbi:hypothetical protein [Roseovarius mucosus]|uniref:hypothetical protein n=1 Tax=Roseovarius mucosus TaxID=215743 RepID=UPI003BAB02AE
METKPEVKSLWQSIQLAWRFAGQSTRFGRWFILGELFFAAAAIIFSILARRGEVSAQWLPLSGFYLMFVALGELQFELWMKQQDMSNRDAIIIGYRAISRFAMAMVFIATIMMFR